ncbi:MAG: DUF4258 domain-containing protein [Bacteroidota bacterium]
MAWNARHQEALEGNNKFVAEHGEVRPQMLEHLDLRYQRAVAAGNLAEAQRIKEGWVPILGSGVAAYEALEEDKTGQAAFHAAMAAGEAVGVGLIAKGAKGAKLAWKARKLANPGAKLWPTASNGRTVINGVEYTTHALERMQPVGTIIKGDKLFSRGIPPSAIENAIKFGKVSPGKTAAEVVRTFENVRVVTNPQGTRVITVIKLGN